MDYQSLPQTGEPRKAPGEAFPRLSWRHSSGFKLTLLCSGSLSHHCWQYQELLPRHSSGRLHMVSHAVLAFCSICILQCCGMHPVTLYPSCLALGLLPAWVCSSVSHLMVLPGSYSADCSVPLQWPGPPPVTEKPSPPTVPEWFKRCEQAANSGKIKQSLNCEIQLSLASASEVSFPCPLKSAHGFARRHDRDAVWCTPYRTARYGKPMPISSSYLTHWHNFMLASLAVLVIFLLRTV